MKYTKYEKARIIGSRALQISHGAPFLISLNNADLKRIRYNPLEIAKMEFEMEKIPITVKRPEPGERMVKKARQSAAVMPEENEEIAPEEDV